MVAHLSVTGVGPERARRRPQDHVRLTTPQGAFVGLCPITVRLALMRGGNQIGKSWALAYDIATTARGTNPYRTTQRPVPVVLLVGGYSWSQMDPLLEKLWSLLPKDEIDPKVRYEKKRGFTGYKQPHVKFTSGPGAGSIIVFFTYEQGPASIMGATADGAYCDEPPPEKIYGELLARLLRQRGFLRIGMTPTPESPPLDYLREKVEAGRILEHQVSLTAENVTIRGGLLDRPLMLQSEIDSYLDDFLDIERAMRRDGDWEPLHTGRWISAYGDAHFTDDYPSEEVYIAVGIDHGAKAGRQGAMLVACTLDGSRVWFLDEARSDGRTSPEEDAQAILDMLARHGWSWEDVDFWIGDRAHSGDQYGNEKDNDLLLEAFAEVLQKTKRLLRRGGLKINTPTKHARSVYTGCRLMNGLFKAGRASVSHERCPGFNESLRRWEGVKSDPQKDLVDAGRYALEELKSQGVLKNRIPTTSPIYA